MDAYFAGKGDKTELNDYFQPLQDIAVVYEGKLSENAYRRCINWIAKALTFDNVGASNRTRLLMMMGDCLKNTGDNAKAKQSYNQAFLASAQIENKMEMQQLQQGIQQSLQGLWKKYYSLYALSDCLPRQHYTHKIVQTCSATEN